MLYDWAVKDPPTNLIIYRTLTSINLMLCRHALSSFYSLLSLETDRFHVQALTVQKWLSYPGRTGDCFGRVGLYKRNSFEKLRLDESHWHE